MAEPSELWCTNPSSEHPFKFVGAIHPAPSYPGTLHSVALFPWDELSFHDLFDGDLSNKSDSLGDWRKMISTWKCTAAVGGTGFLKVQDVHPARRGRSIVVPLPELSKELEKFDKREVVAIAWALRFDRPLEPLILFAHGSILYALNVETRQIVARLRGHGQPITSIAVHPAYPNFICTTSRDFTTRIYDLAREPRNFPPGQSPPLDPHTGPLFGQFLEDEGHGFGRCVAVLAGGRAGGHMSAVLGAAFHPVHPLIATCGMDRHVKIWKIPPNDVQDPNQFAKEDKPLFSSSRIHTARVLSVAWLADDILVTHSAPAMMRKQDAAENDEFHEGEYELYMEEGTVAVWQWLGLNRFCPPGDAWPTILNGCASDYQESSSFTMISNTSLPMDTLHAPVYRVDCHPFLLMLPLEARVRMFAISHLPPQKPVPFAVARRGFRTDEEVHIVQLGASQETEDVLGEKGGEDLEELIRPPALGEIEGWDLTLDELRGEQPVTCAMGASGALVVTIGSRGTIWTHAIINSEQQ